MSTPGIPFPVNVQENQISANLNSSMFLNFLMGIYTMVYGGTMYLYLSKKPANLNRLIVLSTISVLYLICFLYFIVQWYFLDWVVVVNGDTRESIFLSTVGDGLEWTWILNDFLQISMFIISDGLLIWRCYHVWGQSFWAILAPLILLVAEFGLFVATTAFNAQFGWITSDANATLFNNISSALIFVSLGTTVIVTFIIGYRVHSTSRIHHLSSRRLYNHIVIIIIESAAAYSLVLLFEATLGVVPSSVVFGSPWSDAVYYVEVILTVVSGMAPTVLVARIALTDSNSTDASGARTQISGNLQFGSQQGSGSSHSGDTTGGDVDASVHADEAELTPVIEVKREFSADATSGDNQV
ncbi:hypothetical protein CVT25_000818 [Psilocybe cyanescens]|uniref:Uncharacterized protein n=1 Tax=Psilocybe cyanescens TaxID=93625 RepID=A0A409XS40_PSICY|nr:hypothetical protein CVT25_000818 [Psilocybe cyanescens]